MRTTRLSNEQLLNSLSSFAGRERRLIVQVLIHLGEVEERRLHLDRAYTSMYDFCRRKLGYSEGESYRRVAGARLVRRFPQLRDMLASGAIGLTNLVLLATVIHEHNFDELIAAIRGKTKKEVERLVAGLAPKRDVPDAIRAVKAQTIMVVRTADGAGPNRAADSGSGSGPNPLSMVPAGTRDSEAASTASAPPVPTMIAAPPPLATAPTSPTEGGRAALAHDPRVVQTTSTQTGRATCESLVDVAEPLLQQLVVALSADRFKVTFTASDELRSLIEKARGLMRHTNPKGDLATIFESALKLLIAELEKRKFGKTKRPRKSAGPADPADVSRETLRAVSVRDAEQCAYVADDGTRCPARELLEVDHRHARALGGSGQPENLRLLCRPHNQREAEKTFGRAHIERKRRLRQERQMASEVTLTLNLPTVPGSVDSR